MAYVVLSILIISFIYLLKTKMPKSPITIDYFKGDLSLLEEDNIPTY